MAYQRRIKAALAVIILATASFTTAFQIGVSPSQSKRALSTLFSSAPSTDASAKLNVIATAERLKKENGVFLIDPKAQEEIETAVKDLEATVEGQPRLNTPDVQESYLGEWKLVCTVASPKRKDLPKLPALPNNPIRESLANASNKFVTVKQDVRSRDDSSVVNRVDHVIEYLPADEVGSLLSAIPNLPEAFSSFKLPNPLQVSKAKVVLVHDATVSDSETSLFQTKLTLKSVVLNVAGTSTSLDPNGADVLGLNLPGIQDFTGRDVFETTYMDETLRISRTEAGIIDQLRVFVRDSPNSVSPPMTETQDAFVTMEGNDEEVDVASESDDDDDYAILDEEEDDVTPSA